MTIRIGIYTLEVGVLVVSMCNRWFDRTAVVPVPITNCFDRTTSSSASKLTSSYLPHSISSFWLLKGLKMLCLQPSTWRRYSAHSSSFGELQVSFFKYGRDSVRLVPYDTTENSNSCFPIGTALSFRDISARHTLLNKVHFCKDVYKHSL